MLAFTRYKKRVV